MEKIKNQEVVAPWEIVRDFQGLWDLNKLSWIVITIVLVFGIYSITTRVAYKKKPSWKSVSLWSISIIGWGFIMYYYMWGMMKVQYSWSIYLLLGSCLLSIIGFIVFFKITEDPEKKLWVSKIISGIIMAIIVFGVIIFMGDKKQELGLAVIMGSLLGAFISLSGYHIINMIEHGKNQKKGIKDDDDWEIPNLS